MEKFIKEIKNIAVKHQNGVDVTCLKSHIDVIINSYSSKINYDLYVEKEEWTKLYKELGKYCNITSPPECMAVMKITRKRVNAKKHLAICRINRRLK